MYSPHSSLRDPVTKKSAVSLLSSNPQRLPLIWPSRPPQVLIKTYEALPFTPTWLLTLLTSCHFLALLLSDPPPVDSLLFCKHLRHTPIYQPSNLLLLFGTQHPRYEYGPIPHFLHDWLKSHLLIRAFPGHAKTIYLADFLSSPFETRPGILVDIDHCCIPRVCISVGT